MTNKQDDRDIKSWPPGSVMIFDNSMTVLRKSDEGMIMITGSTTPKTPTKISGSHYGTGIVIFNDGVKTIKVLWDAGCKEQLCTYDVGMLNYNVIHHG